jgi:hypothetical protein
MNTGYMRNTSDWANFNNFNKEKTRTDRHMLKIKALRIAKRSIEDERRANYSIINTNIGNFGI